ncbi:hypothetical protein ACWEQL_35720 [Kitasatospora sp. NPDC004240]
MICPHCERRLLQKQRTDHTCQECGKRFALDPKTEYLSDRRITHLASLLTDRGRLVCTTDQLRLALEPRTPHRPRAVPKPSTTGARVRLAVAAVLTSVAVLSVGTSGQRRPVLFTALLLIAAYLALRAASRLHRARRERARAARPSRVYPSWSEYRFRQITQRWTAVYGGLPEGVVEDAAVRPSVPPGRPLAAVLCTDPTATACLHANRFPEGHRVVLVSDVEDVPDGLPVVLLHDASAAGFLLAGEVAAALPGRRVVDAGLPPRAGLPATPCVRMRDVDELPDVPDLAERLAAVPGLDEQARDWYAAGWWSPLAAVRPALLLDAAAKAVERATAPASLIEQRRPEGPTAEAVGFLTWPEEATA